MTTVVFGDTVAHGSGGTPSAGYEFASPFTLSGSDPDALLTKITARLQGVAGGSPNFLACWRDTTGAPNQLVGYGSVDLGDADPEAFYDATSLTLVDDGGKMPDATYWLGILVPTGAANRDSYFSVAGTGKYNGPGFATPSNPFGTIFDLGVQVVINATVTLPAPPAGGQPPIPFPPMLRGRHG